MKNAILLILGVLTGSNYSPNPLQTLQPNPCYRKDTVKNTVTH